MQRTIQVDKRLLIGLMGLALAALLALAFLLGRESRAPREAQARVPQTGNPAPSFEAVASSAQRAASISPLEPVDAPMRAAVAAYFDAVDRLQPGDLNGGPESAARGILASLMKGDSSGFDALIQQAESARARLAALSPPQPCAAYHRESLANLDEGLTLMRAMKTALAGQVDSAQISDLSVRASALKARSESLDQEEQALRRRFGLPQKP